MDEYEDAYFMVLCQYCEKKIPAISLDEHEDMCDGFINYISRGEHLVNPELEEEEDNINELIELCKSCGDVYPVVCMDDHKLVCEPFLAERNLINFDAESTDDDKSALSENEQNKSVDTQEIKKEIKLEIREECKLQKTSVPKAETKESKKSGNVFTTDFEAGSSKNFENANPTRKTQKYPPIECEYVDDSTDDVKHISDDDCEETLEEFWTRARERLKRRRMLNAQ